MKLTSHRPKSLEKPHLKTARRKLLPDLDQLLEEGPRMLVSIERLRPPRREIDPRKENSASTK